MDKLETLYALAEQHLSGEKPQWPQFAAGFKATCGADMVIYHLAPHTDAPDSGVSTFDTWQDRLTIIATSDEKTIHAYLAQDLGTSQIVADDTLPPLEPIRRTDFCSDEDWPKLGPVAEFMIAQGMFYDLMVPAVLDDGSFVRLFLWRDRPHGPFDDREKQRIALYMRYLLAKIDPKALLANAQDDSVVVFGEKYGLTSTEVEVLELLLQGFAPKAIATQTKRTYGTVRWHVQNILEKCRVDSQRKLLHEFYALIKH